MKLSSEIIYQELAKLGSVSRAGKRIDTLSLRPPVFGTPDTVYADHGIYIGTGMLKPPAANLSCLIICTGCGFTEAFLEKLKAGKSCAYVLPDADISAVFNAVQEAFLRYSAWDECLHTILETTADLQEMTDQTAAILNKAIAAVDSRLNFLYGSTPAGVGNSPVGVSSTPVGESNTSASVGSTPGGESSSYAGESSTLVGVNSTPVDVNSLPAAASDAANFDSELSVQEVASWSALHRQNTEHREPFLYEHHGVTVYCINLYLGGIYRGILTMAPVSAADEGTSQILFTYFSEIFMKAMEKARDAAALPPGMRGIFQNVLNGLPVNAALLSREKESFPVRKWRCLVIRPHGEMVDLPLEYFCRQLEEHFTASCALIFDSRIVLFLPVRAHQNPGGLPHLADELRDFDICCGVSHFFEQAEDAAVYYRQAKIALELSQQLNKDEKLAYFKDYALPYALINSTGELSPRDLWPQGLKKIRDGFPRPDSWDTLRTYLDLEMNAAQTARVLYVHRTTLQAHLRKIEDLVNLSTPESRMYIRWCIYLDELSAKL